VSPKTEGHSFKSTKMKKTIPLLFIGAFLFLLASCVGDPYYEKLNTPPTIAISSPVDTIKISTVAYTNKASEIITCYDFNMNMRTLSYTSSDATNIFLFDDKSTALTTVQIGNDVETLNQKVFFQAKKEGDYVITFNLHDAFTTSASLAYKVHAFSNLLPLAVVDSCTLTGNKLHLNLTSSYDTDARWGGAIKSYLIYIDGESPIEVISPKINIILSEAQLPHIATTLNVAVRDNDSALSPKVKPTIK